MTSTSSSAIPDQPPVSFCPCRLSREEVKDSGLVVMGYCTAPKEDGSPCGRRWADHPRERDLNPQPAQVRPAGKPLKYSLIVRIVSSHCPILV